MSFSVLGLSHKTAPVELREKLTLGEASVRELVSDRARSAPIDELVILSTCNRTEIYMHSHDPACRAWAEKFLSSHFGEGALEPYLYFKEGSEALQHLFSVVSGLDSMIYGEQEIQKQVKQGYETAKEAGRTAKLFNVIFQRALYVGKLVRTHTGIAHGALSAGSVAVSLAEKIFGELTQSAVLLFGAGEMAEAAARHLLSKKVKELWIANRTFEKAQVLAKRFGAAPLSFEEGERRMHQADIVLTSLGGDGMLFRRDRMEDAMLRRGNRSLFIIDIGVPRNVDSRVQDLDNLYLYDIDDLEQIVRENMDARRGEMEKADKIVGLKAGELWEWMKSLEAGAEKSLKHDSGYLRRSLD